jgi:nucleoside-diphosphate-sugar epimerase
VTGTRIVITGASGNIGTALLGRLGAHPDRPSLVAVARRVPAPTEPYVRACWFPIDLAAPDAAERLRPAFEAATVVIHLAWGFQPSHRPDYLRRTGVGGTRAVFEAAARAGVGHVIHMSSAAVYGPGAHGCTVDETWPATGVPESRYSRDKVYAEAIVHEFGPSGGGPIPRVTVFRPGFVGRFAAGAAVRRYGLPGYLPAVALRHVPLFPIDRMLRIPAVHTEDVVTAIERALPGAAGVRTVNLAAPDAVSAADVQAGFGARGVPVPWRALRLAAEVTWRAHLQPVDGGWVTLAYTTPLLDCACARRVLDWVPEHSGAEVCREAIAGIRSGDGAGGPVLASRGAGETLAVLLTRGGVGRRIPP